jgi:hypothetical protein
MKFQHSPNKGQYKSYPKAGTKTGPIGANFSTSKIYILK